MIGRLSSLDPQNHGFCCLKITGSTEGRTNGYDFLNISTVDLLPDSRSMQKRAFQGALLLLLLLSSMIPYLVAVAGKSERF